MKLLESLQRGPLQALRCLSRLAVLLLAAAIIWGVVTPAAQAQFATGGSGAYRNGIYWIDWGTAGTSIPQVGQTVTKNIPIAGQNLVLTCTINGISGSGTDPDLAIYKPGSYFEDGLDDLYNIGGTDTANTMDIGLINRTAGTNATFTFTCGITLGGVSFPLDGLVFADAETTSETESTAVTLPAGATMRVIERLRAASCDEPYYVDVSGTNYTFRTGIAPVSGFDSTSNTTIDSCYKTGTPSAMAVGFIDNATSATVKISSAGGNQSVALGVMLNIADYGDAPSSYGNVAHLAQLGWTGGTLASGTNTIFPNTAAAPTFTLGAQTQPTAAVLGTTVDLESTQQFSADATGDDTSGIDDETSVTFPTMKRGTTVNVPVVIGGAGRLNAWIDWNGDGDFADSGEQISTDQSVLAGTTTLSVAIPSTAVSGTTFARFRICTATASCNTPTGVSASGEAEDYSLVIPPPVLSISKTSNGPWGTGQSGATYTLTPSNSAGTGATTGTVTVIDVLPSSITPGWTGTQTTNGWSCTFSGQTVTCTSTAVIAAGSTGTNIVLPVNVSGSGGTVTNYASIGGGGDTRNGGVAPTPSASCTPSGMCTSVDTTVIPTTLPAPTCLNNATAVNLLATTNNIYNNGTSEATSGTAKPSGASAYAAGRADIDKQTYSQTVPLITSANKYTIPARTDNQFAIDLRWSWSNGLNEVSGAATFTLTVNGTNYAVMTTNSGSGTGGTIAALNGATISQGVVGATTVAGTYGLNPSTRSYVILPASVTSISTVVMNYNSTATGTTDDDVAYNFDSIYACPPVLNISKTSNGPWVTGQTGAIYTLTPSNTGPLATFGTVTVLDVLPTGITPGWTGTQTTNGWSCTFSGQTVTCTTTAVITAGANGTNIVVPVNVSGAAGTATNYASIGGGGDIRNGGLAPTPGAACTPSGMCTSVGTTVTAAPPLTCATNLYGIFGNTTTTTNVQSLSLANVLGTPAITTIPTSTSNAAMAVSTGGDKVFVMGSDYVLRVYDVPTNTWTTAGTLSGYIVGDGRPLRMAIGPDGTGYLGMSNTFWTFSQTSPYTLSSVKTVSYTDTSGLVQPPFFMHTTGNDSTSGDFFVDADNNLYLMANPSLAVGGIQEYLDLFIIQGLTGASPTAKFAGRFATPGLDVTYGGIAALSTGIYAIGFGGELLSINLANKTVTALPTNTSTTGSDLGTCYYPTLRPLITSTKTVAKTAAGSTDATGDARAFTGDTLTYTIVVRNSGTLVATGVSFQDIIPTGTTYVANSTTVNAAPISDVVTGVMPYASAKTIKGATTAANGQLEVDNTPAVTTDKEFTLTFQVKVNAGTTSISNTGVIKYNDDSTGTSTVATLNTPTTTTPVYFFDYGEDPNSVPATATTNSYKTLLAEDGARHVIDSIHLGSTVDADTNGAPVTFGSIIAATDNDGVIFNSTAGIPTLLNMQNNSTTANTVTVTASAAGFLNAWIDYNQNGLFDTTEKIFADVPVAAGANTLTFNVASVTIPGLTYARFRVTTGSGQATLPTGLAPNGEVEDYAVKLTSSVSNTSTCVANPPKTVGLNFRWLDSATATTTFRRFQRVGALADGTLLDLELSSVASGTSSYPGGTQSPQSGIQAISTNANVDVVYTIKFFVSGTNTPVNVSVANLITDVDGTSGTVGTPSALGASGSEHIGWKASQIFEAQYNSNAVLYQVNNPFTGVYSASAASSYDKMVVGQYGNSVEATYPSATAKAVRLVTKEVSSFDWLYAGGGFGGANIDLTGNTSIVADCPPILNLAKSSSASSWTVGQSGATYTLTATNSGPKATSGTVTLTDKLPTGITVSNGAVTLSGTNAANWACTAASNTLTCTSSTVIAASGTSTFTFPVTVGATATGTLTNYASITGGGDPSTLTNPNSASCAPSNLCASANTSITTVSIPNVTLLKLVRNVTNATTFVSTNVSVKPKDIVEYCIAYENTGGNAANFVLTDYVPFGMVIRPDAYGTGTGVRWSSTTKAAVGDAAAPTGTNLTNITDSPTPDQGTYNSTSVTNPSDPVGSSSHPGLMTLNLGASGLANTGKGTVCFQTQVP